MPRPVLDELHIHPEVREFVAHLHEATLREVQDAIAQHPIVVVGMAQNPFSRKARQTLDAAGLGFHYLEYGSYLSQWRRRNVLKMWTGWPTFPMVFVKGVLVGGAQDVARLISSGELKRASA